MNELLGKKAYAAYLKVTGNKTWDGRTPPTWEGLPLVIREAWCAAGEATAELTRHKAIERVVFIPEAESCAGCRIEKYKRCLVCQTEEEAAGRVRAMGLPGEDDGEED